MAAAIRERDSEGRDRDRESERARGQGCATGGGADGLSAAIPSEPERSRRGVEGSPENAMKLTTWAVSPRAGARGLGAWVAPEGNVTAPPARPGPLLPLGVTES